MNMTRSHMVLVITGLVGAAAYLLTKHIIPWPVSCAIKTVPVLCMAAALLMARRDGFARLVVFGLLLSALGDFLLAMPQQGMFIPGLLSFLLGHLAYLGAFLWESRAPRLGYALPFVAWAVAAGVGFGPHLGDMAIPVMVYLAVICTMMWRATARVGAGATPDLWWGLVGALLFGLSDTVVAYNLFVQEIPAASWVIMLTYWPGQLGLCVAALQRR